EGLPRVRLPRPLEHPMLLHEDAENPPHAASRELARFLRWHADALLARDLEGQLLEATPARHWILPVGINAHIRREIADVARAREHLDDRGVAACNVRADQRRDVAMLAAVLRIRRRRHVANAV